MKIAILGAGALAIGISKVLEGRGFDIVMWTKFESEKEELLTTRVNSKLFPGVRLADEIKITTDIKETINNADVILNVLPFIAIKDTIELIKDYYTENQIIISATKGIDEEKFLTTTELFEECLGATKISALSGPSFAIDVAKHTELSFMLGTKSQEAEKMTRMLLETSAIKMETTDDIVGIQLCGGIKNAIAVGSGMLAGLNVADSTRAAYLATGMTDMARALVSLGGKKETAYSYAGAGDLMLTCMSPTSRNFTFGYYLGQGLTVDEAFKMMNNKTVEGYKVIRALNKYSKEKDIPFYTIPVLYDIVFNGADVNNIKKV